MVGQRQPRQRTRRGQVRLGDGRGPQRFHTSVSRRGGASQMKLSKRHSITVASHGATVFLCTFQGGFVSMTLIIRKYFFTLHPCIPSLRKEEFSSSPKTGLSSKIRLKDFLWPEEVPH